MEINKSAYVIEFLRKKRRRRFLWVFLSDAANNEYTIVINWEYENIVGLMHILATYKLCGL